MRDCLESFLYIADRLPSDESRQEDANFENSNFIPSLKFDTANNSQDFQCKNNIVLTNLQSSAVEDPNCKKRKPEAVGFYKT